MDTVANIFVVEMPLGAVASQVRQSTGWRTGGFDLSTPFPLIARTPNVLSLLNKNYTPLLLCTYILSIYYYLLNLFCVSCASSCSVRFVPFCSVLAQRPSYNLVFPRALVLFAQNYPTGTVHTTHTAPGACPPPACDFCPDPLVLAAPARLLAPLRPHSSLSSAHSSHHPLSPNPPHYRNSLCSYVQFDQHPRPQTR